MTGNKADLSTRSAFTILALAWTVLVALYFHAFRAGYYGEDFAWLIWSRESSFLEIFRSPGGTYFRPLSVRLPYWLFPRLPAGLLLWKFTSFALIGGAAIFFWRWLEALRVERKLALFLAVFWMHSPFQCFPLFYVNAFDYVLFPFLLCGFLYFTEKREWGRGLVFFWLALLAKEWAIAFPVLLLFFGENRPKGKMLVAYLASPIVFSLWSGLFTGGGAVAGFIPGFQPASVFKSMAFFSSRTFSPGFVEQPLFAWGWFIAAGILWVAGLAALMGKRLTAGPVPRLLGCLVVLFTPFFFLSNLQSEFLGGVFWLFLLAIAAIGLIEASRNLLLGTFALAVTGLLVSLPAERIELHRRFASYAHVFDFTLSRAQLFAGKCDPGVQVAWGGMEKLVKNQEEAEHAIWGLRWKFPGRDFFLIKDPASFQENRVILAHRQFWIDREAAVEMLVLETIKNNRGTEVFSPTRGTPGCGLPGGKDTIGI